MKHEVPFVGIPAGDVAPGQLDVGRVVHLTLPSGRQDCFYVSGIYWCEKSLVSPLLLMSRIRGASMYSFAVFLLDVEYSSCGQLRKWYCQLQDRSMDVVQGYEARLFMGLRRVV